MLNTASHSTSVREKTVADPLVPTHVQRRSWDLLCAGLLLGLAADYLVRVDVWGLNVSVWFAALAIATGVLWRRYGEGRDVPLLASIAAVFAGCIAWRASETLTLLNTLALTTTVGLLVWRAHGERVTRLSDVLRGFGRSCLEAMHGPIVLMRWEVPWAQATPASWRGTAALRGVLVALPLVLVFGALFASADAGFAHYATAWVRIDVLDMLGHVWWTVCFGALALGGLRSLFEAPERKARVGWTWRAGAVEVGIVLGALVGVFGLFVAVQAGALFGGLDYLLAQEGLTRAEYARSGFFEMAWAAALLLTVLLVADGRVGDDDAAARRVYQRLTVGLLALMTVVMASAMYRMHLYQQTYGLTELRFYVTAFIGWLAVVFGWFAWTVLRGERERFAAGTLLWGLLAVFLLNLVNPDLRIAHSHLARLEAGHTADPRYVVHHLSTDAYPAARALWPHVATPEGRWSPATELRHDTAGLDDWRSWNWSRWRAARFVADTPQSIETAVAPPTEPYQP